MADDELEELRRRKLQELQSQAAHEQQANAQRAAMESEAEAQKALIFRTILDPEARERLARVRMARPDVAASLENQLLTLYQQGRIRGVINDELMKQFLSRVTPKSRDIHIERR